MHFSSANSARLAAHETTTTDLSWNTLHVREVINIHKSVLSCVPWLTTTTWHCPHLLLYAVLQHGCCWPLASWFCSNRSMSPGCWATAAKSQKRHANRTDGLTPNNCINPAPQSTYYAGNANNKHSVKQLQMSCLNLLLHWNEPSENVAHKEI